MCIRDSDNDDDKLAAAVAVAVAGRCARFSLAVFRRDNQYVQTYNVRRRRRTVGTRRRRRRKLAESRRRDGRDGVDATDALGVVSAGGRDAASEHRDWRVD